VSRDRDRKLDQALKQQMRAAALPGGDSHVDAETIAAWSDGGLDPVSMLSVEEHLSSCTRCQAIAGAMARSAPVTSAVVERRGFNYWFFAPLAAGIAAVGLWAIVPSPQQREAAIEQAKPVAVAPVAPAAPEPPPAQATAAPLPSADAARVAPAPQPRAPLAAAGRREQAADQLARSDAKLADKEEAQTGGTASGTASRAAAANAIAAAAPAAPAVEEPVLQKAMRPAPVPLEIISPDQNHRWRVVQTGLELSLDRGKTWSPVRAAREEIITGGTAVSGTILWLIGKDGLVLVTVDGVTFATVRLPVRVDVTSITATDARSATVTTADGRTFRTDDSGRNWKQN
jgi:hypothetical protein